MFLLPCSVKSGGSDPVVNAKLKELLQVIITSAWKVLPPMVPAHFAIYDDVFCDSGC